jgi:hypothetical protein
LILRKPVTYSPVTPQFPQDQHLETVRNQLGGMASVDGVAVR